MPLPVIAAGAVAAGAGAGAGAAAAGTAVAGTAAAGTAAAATAGTAAAGTAAAGTAAASATATSAAAGSAAAGATTAATTAGATAATGSAAAGSAAAGTTAASGTAAGTAAGGATTAAGGATTAASGATTAGQAAGQTAGQVGSQSGGFADKIANGVQDKIKQEMTPERLQERAKDAIKDKVQERFSNDDPEYEIDDDDYGDDDVIDMEMGDDGVFHAVEKKQNDLIDNLKNGMAGIPSTSGMSTDASPSFAPKKSPGSIADPFAKTGPKQQQQPPPGALTTAPTSSPSSPSPLGIPLAGSGATGAIPGGLSTAPNPKAPGLNMPDALNKVGDIAPKVGSKGPKGETDDFVDGAVAAGKIASVAFPQIKPVVEVVDKLKPVIKKIGNDLASDKDKDFKDKSLIGKILAGGAATIAVILFILFIPLIMLIGCVGMSCTMLTGGGGEPTVIEKSAGTFIPSVAPMQMNTGEDESSEAAYGGDIEENSRLIWSALTEICNFSDEQVAGMLSNFEAESGVDPTTIETIYDEPYQMGPRKTKAAKDLNAFETDCKAAYAKGSAVSVNWSAYYSNGKFWPGIGLAQWTGGGSERFVTTSEKVVNGEWWRMDYSVAYMIATGSPCGGGGGADFFDPNKPNTYASKSFSSPKEAANAFSLGFEHGAMPAKLLEGHAATANDWYNKMSGWTADSSFASSVKSMVAKIKESL